MKTVKSVIRWGLVVALAALFPGSSGCGELMFSGCKELGERCNSSDDREGFRCCPELVCRKDFSGDPIVLEYCRQP